jgi:hypothetical protein
MAHHRTSARWTGLLLLPLLAGCGGGTTAAPVPTRTAAPEPTPAPVQFRTADGNVGCDVEARHVVCTIGERAWAAPPKPVQCHGSWGAALQFTLISHPSFVCGQRTSYRTAARVLAADETVRVGFIACHAVPGGVRCFGEVHGFLLTKARPELF